MDDGRLVVGGGGKLTAYDLANGKQLWSVAGLAVDVRVSGKRVYVRDTDSLSAFDATTGKHIGSLGGE